MNFSVICSEIELISSLFQNRVRAEVEDEVQGFVQPHMNSRQILTH